MLLADVSLALASLRTPELVDIPDKLLCGGDFYVKIRECLGDSTQNAMRCRDYAFSIRGISVQTSSFVNADEAYLLTVEDKLIKKFHL